MASPNRGGDQQDDLVGSHNCVLMMYMMRKHDVFHTSDEYVHGDDAIHNYYVIVHDHNIMITKLSQRMLEIPNWGFVSISSIQYCLFHKDSKGNIGH